MRKPGLVICLMSFATAVVVIVGWSLLLPDRQSQVEFASSDGFVGLQTCAKCHPNQAADHDRSGHAHTFHRAVDSDVARRWHGKVFEDPERDYTYHYQFNEAGLSVTIPSRFGDQSFPLDFVFGSGTHAVSFLSLVPNRAGGTDGVEHRVSSFGRQEKLALTPGQRAQTAGQAIEEFGTVVLQESTDLARCIECHTTTASIHGPNVENLRPNVTCESCHGAGQAHVQAQRQKSANGESQIASRWKAQAQLEMCGRCHRRTDWLSAPPDKQDIKIVRFQPVGLSQSRCYQESAGCLRCTTCHDPHLPPATDAAHYDRICLECHTAAQQTSAQHLPADCPSRRPAGCVGCHLPPIQLHPGFVFSDHWIRIRTSDDLPADPK